MRRRTTSDTEVVLHLFARSRQPSVVDALLDALTPLAGAFTLLALTPDTLFGARDPRGFRPLVLGELMWALDGRSGETLLTRAARCRHKTLEP